MAPLTKCHFDDKTKKDETLGACSTHRKNKQTNKQSAQTALIRDPEGRTLDYVGAKE